MKTKARKIIFAILALAALGFVGWIILSADRGNMPSLISFMYSFPNGDKLGHFLLMGALAFVVTLALPLRFRRIGLIVLAVALTAEEFSQQFFASRSASWLDLACSLAGVAVFGLLALRITRSFKKQEKIQEERS